VPRAAPVRLDQRRRPAQPVQLGALRLHAVRRRAAAGARECRGEPERVQRERRRVRGAAGRLQVAAGGLPGGLMAFEP